MAIQVQIRRGTNDENNRSKRNIIEFPPKKNPNRNKINNVASLKK